MHGLDPRYDPPTREECFAIAVQADGRILAAGRRLTGHYTSGNDFIVRRYEPNGAIDKTFGDATVTAGRTGSAVLDIFGGEDTVEHILVRSDGRILLGGNSRLPEQIGQPGSLFYTIARLTPSGKLDRTFGKSGKVYSVDGVPRGPTDLVLAPHGSILLGHRRPDAIHVTRFAADTGAMQDVASISVPTTSGSFDGTPPGIDLAVTVDQHVVAVTDDGEDWVQARFTLGEASIEPDFSFASGGTQITDFGPNYTVDPCNSGSSAGDFLCLGPYTVADAAADVFVQPDGRLIITGSAALPARLSFAMVRFVDPGTIAGNLFVDVAADGVKGAEDDGRAGFRVFLDRDNDAVCDQNELQTRTSSTGRFMFSDLPVGAYFVRATPVQGWRATTNLAYKVTVGPGASVTRHFGVTRNVLITGTVFMDANVNGGKDAAEGGLSAWRVFCDADGDGVLDDDEISVLTDATGRYAIGTLAGGTHRIRVVQQGDYQRTSPASGYRTVSLLPGAVARRINFGQTRIVI